MKIVHIFDKALHDELSDFAFWEGPCVVYINTYISMIWQRISSMCFPIQLL